MRELLPLHRLPPTAKCRSDLLVAQPQHNIAADGMHSSLPNSVRGPARECSVGDPVLYPSDRPAKYTRPKFVSVP